MNETLLFCIGAVLFITLATVILLYCYLSIQSLENRDRESANSLRVLTTTAHPRSIARMDDSRSDEERSPAA